MAQFIISAAYILAYSYQNIKANYWVAATFAGMKKHVFVLLSCLSLTVCFGQSKRARAKADKLTTANLQTEIIYLAGDDLKGRRAGTPEEMKAAEYISNLFKQYGLKPAGDNDTYLQSFEVDKGKHFTGDENSVTINGQTLKLKTEYYPLAFTADANIEGSASPLLREGKEPWFFNVSDMVEDNHTNPHFDVLAAIRKEAEADAAKGAKALIVYNSSAFPDNIYFNKADNNERVPIPVIFITQAGMQKYLADATNIYNISIKTALSTEGRTAHNVIGFLNNNAPATVVIGAHYDHLGMGEDGNSLDGEGEIHNGADDNASGTAGLIELAHMMKGTKDKNNNYLFIAFSGEELGLLGSKYWLQNQTVPVDINYMLNMDMIGRYTVDKKLSIGGYGTSPAWGELFNVTNDPDLLTFFDSSGNGPSDHAAFYMKDIPVLFFFTGVESDYHKATDDADKINYTGETEILNFIQKIIHAADDKGKLEFSKTNDPQMQAMDLPVTLGVMPDYSYSKGDGMRIDAVSKGKTAERAGLKAGDILQQLGDYKFGDVVSYMQALQHFNKGDKTKLIISRDGKKMSVDVQW